MLKVLIMYIKTLWLLKRHYSVSLQPENAAVLSLTDPSDDVIQSWWDLLVPISGRVRDNVTKRIAPRTLIGTGRTQCFCGSKKTNKCDAWTNKLCLVQLFDAMRKSFLLLASFEFFFMVACNRPDNNSRKWFLRNSTKNVKLKTNVVFLIIMCELKVKFLLCLIQWKIPWSFNTESFRKSSDESDTRDPKLRQLSVSKFEKTKS